MPEDRSYRILLCDDDPDESFFLESAFIKAGYKVDLEWFSRCSTLLDHLPVRPETPDLIFLDVNMPGESGLECLADVRKFPTYKNVPVIIYTTSSLGKDIEVAFKNGASLFLTKTSSEEELIDVVNYVIKKGPEGLQCPKREGFCYIPKKGFK